VSPTPVPFTAVPLGRTTFQITTSVGRQLQTYDLRRGLNLIFLSTPQTPQEITATCAYKDRVFLAWGRGQNINERGLWVFKRGKLIEQLQVPESSQEIRQLKVMGAWLVGCGTKTVEVWKSNKSSYEHYTSLSPSGSGLSPNEQILCGLVCTMPTYLNKIVVARLDGMVEIWNISTGKCVHTILPPKPGCGTVTALQPTPALSHIVVAYADGSLIIHDVEHDDVVLSFHQSTFPITSVTFRTDGLGAGEDGREDGVMATASVDSGDITLWDLNGGGRVAGTLRAAHEMTAQKGVGVTGIEFLPDQAVLVSTGLDNALRTWIFDQTPFSPVPRILHTRSGHGGPVTTAKFLPASSDGSDAASKWLLSASEARDLWGFSLRRDGQSSELSQGNVKHKAKKMGRLHDASSTAEDLKAPPIAMMACSLNRDGGMGASGGPIWKNTKSSNAEESSTTGWESIVTAHENDNVARTWFWGRKRAGRWTLRTSDNQPVSAVAMTACGTFAIIGSTGGGIDMYNLQSGIHRQRFPPKLSPSQAKLLRLREVQANDGTHVARKHHDTVTGIVIDVLNQTVVSCSLDGSIRFWDFATGLENERLVLGTCAPVALRYNATSGLASFACDDLCIRILDIETKKIVRELWGCVGQIYDHCFSHDGRWIVSCAMDSVLRVFDLATGHLIDAFKTATCTSLSFSSTGEYLATTHTGSLGVKVWNNRTLFRHVPSQRIDEDDGILDLTDSTIFDDTNLLVMEEQFTDGPQPEANQIDEIEQLNDELLTLSLVPRSRWQTLLHLDAIRARNRPIEPPKKPEKAPFFLPSALSTVTQLKPVQADANSAVTPAERSRVSRLQQLSEGNRSQFSRVLAETSTTVDPHASAFISHLSSLSPSQMDLEIRSLTLSEMVPFVNALTVRLKLKRDFELVNSFMAHFLRMHGDVVQESESVELKAAMRRWDQAMKKEEERLGQLVGYCKGVVDFLRGSR
jgi:U3 small nucleolar RNA-associated protein 21